jgi:hypothetical protein
MRSPRRASAGSRPGHHRHHHLMERTENERECPNACPEGLSPACASERRWPIGGLPHRSHIGIARRGLRAQMRKKIRAYPILPRSMACFAFEKDHRPTRSVTGSTWRADQARAAIRTRIAGSSFTRRRHLGYPKVVYLLLAQRSRWVCELAHTREGTNDEISGRRLASLECGNPQECGVTNVTGPIPHRVLFIARY